MTSHETNLDSNNPQLQKVSLGLLALGLIQSTQSILEPSLKSILKAIAFNLLSLLYLLGD